MAAVKRAQVVLDLEDGTRITYTVHSPPACSVRGRDVPARDENYGEPVNGTPTQFSVSFGWPKGR
jgi:hypothetical protein